MVNSGGTTAAHIFNGRKSARRPSGGSLESQQTGSLVRRSLMGASLLSLCLSRDSWVRIPPPALSLSFYCWAAWFHLSFLKWGDRTNSPVDIIIPNPAMV